VYSHMLNKNHPLMFLGFVDYPDNKNLNRYRIFTIQ